MSAKEPDNQAPQHSDIPSDDQLGLAGRTARFFIDSPLSPLLFIAMILMGLLGLVMTPRQEDPQISVPMVDVMVRYSGASAEQVASLAIEPLERIMSEIPGVKHVYSASQRGMGLVTIEFDVGEKMGPSLVKVNDKLSSNMDKIPSGVSPPLVTTVGIDDVPVVNVTLWSKDMDGDGLVDVDDGQLRMLAHDVLQSIKEIPDTGKGFVVGGRAEQVTIEVYPERLSGYGISLDQVAQTIRNSNSEQLAGDVESGSTHFNVMTGAFLKTIDDISRLVVGSHNNVPVYVHDVARVTQGPEDASQLVAYYTGPAGPDHLQANGVQAVTIAVAKKEGTNGVTVANAIIKRVNDLKGTRIPANVEVSITRDYGQTADDKVNELIFKLFMATGFVFILVLLAFRALRPALVVVLVIPVVLLMTIFYAWVTGYTIDRVSLFALIFSIGILVDDAIVVVENIYRRWLEEGKTDIATAVDAVREVGNPTILATFTVIAALLPMGFVSGMMGPYMEPIPALGSAAMLISLFAAFVYTPWLAISRWLRPSMSYLQVAEKREHKAAERMEGFYRRLLLPMIEHPSKRFIFRVLLWGSFFFACSMFYTKWVAVKMLPLDNKPEFSVVLDMPEGTALPVTANMAHQIAQTVRKMPEVTAVQVYAGTARPFDFNGMVRHYYMRKDPWLAEVQVQLLHKTKRDRSSHELAVQARADLQQLIEGTGAKIAVVEMPPGPPVLQSVVAEVHGPSAEVRQQFAADLTRFFQQAESLTDVDNYMRDSYDYWRFDVDTEKAVRRGVSVNDINRNLSMALGGMVLGDVKQRAGHEPINIVIQVPLAERSQITRLGDLPIQSSSGVTLPLRELGRFEKVAEDPIIFHKDLRPIEFVVADVGGELAAPVYGMFQVQDMLIEHEYVTPDGVNLAAGGMLEDGFHWFGPPENDTKSSIEWTGEWTVTFETFRDMGAAFMVALVLIYILVVWEFGNFRIPALIMAPIPLTLLGIIPAHAIAGAEFTATSMIGWIALAGIIVRNSILLVDFSLHEIQNGTQVVEAVIRSCKTRTRPIMITALALVCGSSVIFTDPIFQGMAISLASGVMVSTVLTLIVIPLGCIKAKQSLIEVAAAGMDAHAAAQLLQDQQTMPAAPVQTQPATASSTTSVPKAPLLIRIWGKIINILIMTFYAIRGIFLLISQLFKRKRSAAPVKAAQPTTTTASGAPAANPVKNVSPSKKADEINKTVATKTDGITSHAQKSSEQPDTSVVPNVPQSKELEKPGTSDKTVKTQSAVETADLKSEKIKAEKGDAERTNVVAIKRTPAGKKSATKKTARKKVAKKASVKNSVVKKRPASKATVENEKEAIAANESQQKNASQSKDAENDNSSSQPNPKSGSAKKGGRRGIRLRNISDSKFD